MIKTWKSLGIKDKTLVKGAIFIIKELANKFPRTHDAYIYGSAVFELFQSKISDENISEEALKEAEKEAKFLVLKFLWSLLPIEHLTENVYEVSGVEIRTKVDLARIVDLLLSSDLGKEDDQSTFYDVIFSFLKYIGVNAVDNVSLDHNDVLENEVDTSDGSNKSKQKKGNRKEQKSSGDTFVDDLFESHDTVPKEILPVDASDVIGGEVLLEKIPPEGIPDVVTEILLVVKDTNINHKAAKDPTHYQYLKKWDRAFKAIIQESTISGNDVLETKLTFYMLLLLKVLAYATQRPGDGLLFLASLIAHPAVPIIFKSKSEPSIVILSNSSLVYEVHIPMSLFNEIQKTLNSMIFGIYPSDSKVYKKWIKKGSLFLQ